MKHYELTYLISPELSKEEADSLSIEISSLVQKKQGILEKTKVVSKKQLAYHIKKKAAAYLASLNFQIRERQRSVEGETRSLHPKPEGLEEIKKQIESNPKILRYLILTISEETPSLLPRFADARATKAKLKIAPKTIKVPLVTRASETWKRDEVLSIKKTKKVIPPKKVELKEIEKKLEDILK